MKQEEEQTNKNLIFLTAEKRKIELLQVNK